LNRARVLGGIASVTVAAVSTTFFYSSCCTTDDLQRARDLCDLNLAANPSLIRQVPLHVKKPQNHKRFVLHNGQILGPNGNVFTGSVIVEGSKIKRVEVGDYTTDESIDQVVDCSSLYISPGFIDAHTHVGMHVWGTNIADVNESGGSPLKPELRAFDSICHDSPDFYQALSSGVTTVVVCPGSSNIMGGQCCAIKTCDGVLDDKLLHPFVAMKVALGDNPKRSKVRLFGYLDIVYRIHNTRRELLSQSHNTLYKSCDDIGWLP
jgi:imidazolonepropionase-like amidohydrolase